MTSSSDCFFLVSMVVLLQFSATALASTKYIDTICRMEYVKDDKTFCLQTLNAYPPAVAAKSLSSLVDIAIGLGISYAEKTAGFAAEATLREDKDTTLKKQFMGTTDHFRSISWGLRMSRAELKDDPMSGNYDAMICYDQTRYVRDLIGKNRDKTSKKLMKMTLMMEKMLTIAVGATEAVGG